MGKAEEHILPALGTGSAHEAAAGVSSLSPRALTIAGSDPTSGAGIQADLKTFSAHGVYGLSAIAAVTAQDSHGVELVHAVPADILRAQCEVLLRDIAVTVLKIGMLYSESNVRTVSALVRQHSHSAILDTPFAATNGAPLVEDEAIETLKDELLPLAALITPNIPEAERLTGLQIATRSDMLAAARSLLSMGADAVLLKGGHLASEESSDLFVSSEEELWLSSPRRATRNTHGTGCTLSAAIAANLAKGETLRQSVINAKVYIDRAIEHSFALGSGHGPLGHFAAARDTTPSFSIVNEIIS